MTSSPAKGQGRRRPLRTLGWGALAGLIVLLALPYLVPFSSSGPSSREVAAARSLGEAPTFRQLGGLEVHVEREAFRGARPTDGSPPLLVVLHGFGASTATWRSALDELAVLGEVVAYDRPPFGFTERPAGGGEVDAYGTEGQLALLGEVVEAYRGGDPTREVVLLGHSAGGALAAEYALRDPGGVDGLVLVAPAVLTEGGTPGWLRPLLAFPPVDRAGPWLARAAARGSQRLLEASWHDPARLTAEQRRAYDEPQQVAGWEEGLWRLVRAPTTLRVAEEPSALAAPVLLVTGDDDRVVPTADTVELASLVDGATLTVLERTGHVPHEESPEAFLEAVVEGWPLEHERVGRVRSGTTP
ncbi:MAG: alpha/beta hydrolase [Egibacteraceae bacterium]